MSDKKKLINLQKNISLNEVKNSDINFIERFISKENILKPSTNSRNEYKAQVMLMLISSFPSVLGGNAYESSNNKTNLLKQ